MRRAARGCPRRWTPSSRGCLPDRGWRGCCTTGGGTPWCSLQGWGACAATRAPPTSATECCGCWPNDSAPRTSAAATLQTAPATALAASLCRPRCSPSYGHQPMLSRRPSPDVPRPPRAPPRSLPSEERTLCHQLHPPLYKHWIPHCLRLKIANSFYLIEILVLCNINNSPHYFPRFMV